jgi:hypothetical protein
MKIPGGELDPVEKEFSTFLPGLNFKTLEYDKKKKLRARTRCEIICRN